MAMLSVPAWRIWLRAIARFVSLQLAIQLVGFVTGLVIIRMLPVNEYGTFALLTAVMMIVQQLADTGTGSALASLGGAHLADRPRFLGLVRGIGGMRLHLAAVVLLLLPLLAFGNALFPILVVGEWTPTPLVSVALSLWVAGLLWFWAWPQVRIDVLGAALRLEGRAALAQRVELGVSGARLLVFAALGLAAPISHMLWLVVTAWVAFLFVHALALRLAHRPIRSDDAHFLPEDRAETRRLVRAQILYNALFVAQGQFALLALAFWGTNFRVGEFGALGRLAAVFTVFNALQNGLILPAFARLPAEPARLQQRFHQVALAGLGVGLALWWFTWLFPQPLLWLLGDHFQGRSAEFAWLMAGHAVLYLGSVLWSLNYARGWIEGSWLVPLSALAVQLAGCAWLNPSTVLGAAQLVLLSALPAIPLQFWLMRRGVRGLRLRAES